MAIPDLVATELRLHHRHGVLAATAAMTSVWVVLLRALPEYLRPEAVPWVLFLELATLGFFFVPALAVSERANGVTAALRLTRLSPARALGVRIGTLALSALTAAVVVVPAGGLGWAPPVLAGAALTSGLVSLLAVVMVGRADSLTSYMARVPAVAVPLLLPALLHGTGLWDAGFLAVSPATGALELLSGRWSWPAAAWITSWLAGLWVAAVHIGFDVEPVATKAVRPSSVRAAGGSVSWTAVRSFAGVDRRTLLGDRILLLLVAGVPLIALGVRWASGPGLVWAENRFGIHLAGDLPMLWAFVLVVHTPVMFGAVAGLLFLEDRDAGLLPAVILTRASLVTLLAYRLTALVLVTSAAVAVGVVVAGAEHEAGAAGVFVSATAAGVVASVPAMLLATVARDRIQGMALMKAMGVPLYLPLAWWFVDTPAGWLFAVLPTGWLVRTFWAPSLAAAVAYAAGGIIMVSAFLVTVQPRLRRGLVD